MFDHPGKKVQTLASVLSVLLGGASLVIGVLLAGTDVLISVGVILGGVLVAYVTGLLLYSLGSLVDNSQEIRDSLFRLENGDFEPEEPATPAVRPEKPERVGRRFSSDEGEKTWQCDCGAVNPNRIKTCSCGRSLYEVVANRLGQQEE